jgi:hypothetical protein
MEPADMTATSMNLGVDTPKAAVIAIDCHRGHLDPEVATMPVAADVADAVIAANKALMDRCPRGRYSRHPSCDPLPGRSGNPCKRFLAHEGRRSG